MYTVTLWLLIRVALLLFICIPLLNWLARSFKKTLVPRFGLHGTMLIINTFYYGGIALVAITVLHEFGFQIHTLLGAAGVVGIAVGFAAQTSISNIISGIFLLIEQPFRVGDDIECEGGAKGQVYAIDLMAVKIRTTQNTLIRISNTDLLKKEITNKTYFNSRRIEWELQIPYSYDTILLSEEIRNLVKAHPYYIEKHPVEIVLYKIVQQGPTGQLWRIFHLYAWSHKEQAILFRNQILTAIDQMYTKKDIPGLITVIN